jgi:hypothetical protein
VALHSVQKRSGRRGRKLGAHHRNHIQKFVVVLFFILIHVVRAMDGLVPSIRGLHYANVERLSPGEWLDDEVVITGLR